MAIVLSWFFAEGAIGDADSLTPQFFLLLPIWAIKWKNTIMIVSLFGILLFFSLNILVGMKVIVNDYITSDGTSIGGYASFIVHMIAKFSFRNKKQQTKMTNTLLK